MSAADQIGLADELIDAARPCRLLAKTLVPSRERVALEIGERPAVAGDDELIHIGMGEVASHELILLIRVAPPAPYLQRVQPVPDQHEVGARHRTKGVIRSHLSRSA